METYLVVLLVLAVLGIFNTLYLSSHAITKKPVKCLWFPEEWCIKVQQSKYSRTLGIPNAFAGLGMYVAILVLTLLFISGSISFTPIFWLVVFGFAFSMYFLFIQAFVLRAFCTWCVISIVEFTLLFITVMVSR
ncbi:MAG: vitamin K epoxide reductase family protein [Candidatus Doudnabacteria bacterium]